MSVLQRLFGRTGPSTPTQRELAAEVVEAEVEDEDLVEIEVHGESHYQEALEGLAGSKEAVGKQVLVGVTLRCEPGNEYDHNAIRVEVMGQLLGRVARDQAALVSPPMRQKCGGVLEARGLIVGGWRDAQSEGYFGIRVWISGEQARRLGVELATRQVDAEPRMATPELPAPGAAERRLSPNDADIAAQRWGKTVTVVDEQNYQDAVLASLPPGWDRHWCPVLVELDLADRNPHSKHTTPCVEVRIDARTVGFLTPAMTQRYLPLVEAAKRDGLLPTATASAHRGEKGGQTFWRIKIEMQNIDSP